MKNNLLKKNLLTSPKILELNMIRDGIHDFNKFKIAFYDNEKLLRKSYILIDINLSCNFIDDELILKILNFKLLNYTKNLYSLNLSFNRITKNSLINILEFLSKCSNLNNFCCEYNLFNEDEFYECLLNSKLT